MTTRLVTKRVTASALEQRAAARWPGIIRGFAPNKVRQNCGLASPQRPAWTEKNRQKIQ
jgi:hypothetical protein